MVFMNHMLGNTLKKSNVNCYLTLLLLPPNIIMFFNELPIVLSLQAMIFPQSPKVLPLSLLRKHQNNLRLYIQLDRNDIKNVYPSISQHLRHLN